MRTAKEMYDFCKENGYGRGFNEKTGTKHFKLIEENLGAGEEVLLAFIGLHNYVSMSKHDGNFAFAMTNKRILMAQKRVIGQVVQSVLYDKLNDITFSTGMMIGMLHVDTIGEGFNVALDKAQAKNIYNSVQEIFMSRK